MSESNIANHIGCDTWHQKAFKLTTLGTSYTFKLAGQNEDDYKKM